MTIQLNGLNRARPFNILMPTLGLISRIMSKPLAIRVTRVVGLLALMVAATGGPVDNGHFPDYPDPITRIGYWNVLKYG